MTAGYGSHENPSQKVLPCKGHPFWFSVLYGFPWPSRIRGCIRVREPLRWLRAAASVPEVCRVRLVTIGRDRSRQKTEGSRG